jgi:hypothetical protein
VIKTEKKKIPKIITSIYTSNVLLIALSTYSIGKVGDIPKDFSQEAKEPKLLFAKNEESEKVVVSGKNRQLYFTIAGKPGRHCAIVYRTEHMKKNDYRLIADKKTIIGKEGVVTVIIDMAQFLDQKVYFVVITSNKEAYADSKQFKEMIPLDQTDFRGTPPFEIFMSSKKISEIKELNGITGNFTLATAGVGRLHSRKQ